ncbi:MAG: GTP-sensing pleiotropic transcriptional regulator CodY [Synergistaceae bacterium]|nr:GTP-sensing pleiotropic transcriptional regulator CodY [Synergistaceae bacterium]MBQ3449066.1 GTP-sensing pleiotropic transcriptional regulator CodY [Synergistaceae bacterium]MBQ3694079.1 GTP-sensing pleiotropic transcriptional regulator CodY [Synergistaceae bacterium]MBQ6113226.1 GTP-sensing pleiotropic transcriptional regulator CodY [Synergistaceae bacterium]MBQ9628265.1 GTP-sensing pleiotropic transcriptional regulator CodY [Synergistaceae bacterium]
MSEILQDNQKSDTGKRLRKLLEKTRKVGRAVQAKHEGEPLDYFHLSELLSEFSTANVYIVDKSGNLLGYYWLPEYKSKALSESFQDGVMPEEFVTRMNRCRDSEIHDEDAFLFDDAYSGEKPEKHLMYVPIIGASAERLGTIMLVRFHEPFLVDDVLLAEYLGMLAGIEILNERAKLLEETARSRLSVQMAMRALSYSELESMKHIIAELKGPEGVAIASRVADRVGVTRSVIVNALRKLESAGLIESRSLGMKGTYIKILSPLLLEYLDGKTGDKIDS